MKQHRRNGQLFRYLAPYLKPFWLRISLALACLVLAKMANVGVPLVMKEIVDSLAPAAGVLVVPAALLVAYGVLRLLTTVFNELREIFYTRVGMNVSRSVMLEIFEHLLDLSLRFHSARQTGRLVRDVERGQKSILTLIDNALFAVLPTFVETVFVFAILIYNYDWSFALIALSALIVYVTFTLLVTEWRTNIRRQLNEYDSSANARSTDSLINYETVKYFGNEGWERGRYDEHLALWEDAGMRSQTSLSLLNFGQSVIIAAAITLMMWRATAGVVAGNMSIGDLVLVNSLMIQLYVPLNFLGVIYRQIRQAMADMERLFDLASVKSEVTDRQDAPALALAGGEVRFEKVAFYYEEDRQILHNISFTVPAGKTVALVGPSGAGKSTISKLLFRFYDVTDGRILIDSQDIRDISQASLRKAIGIVPQDTVLFNDTLGYNIGYGDTGASEEDVKRAAGMAQLADFISGLPEGYNTAVGERGLKLSGGEKQRVAIARTILKNPAIYIFDEATSSLDSRSEKQIQAELDTLATGRTTLMIAHRLSTVVNADEILVLEKGRITERGTHAGLIAAGGLYAKMWALQQAEQE